MRPLRVAVYDTSPALGGAVTSLDALAEAGATNDIEITVVARHKPAFAQTECLPRLLAMPEDDVGAIHHGPYLRREMERSAFLRRALAALQPDVLLTNNAPSSNVAAFLAAHSLDLPVVCYVRGFITPTWLTRELLRRARHVLAVGHSVAEQLTGLGVRPLVVGEALSAAQRPSFRNEDATGLFWCGTLARWKGLELMLDAYVLACRAHVMPDLHVCVAPWPEGYKDAGRVPAHLPPGVHIHVCSAKLDLIRAQSMIYVHTSRSEEPFGRSLLEAAHAGLCPIVPDHSSAEGLVCHGETGLSFESENASDLAQTMIRAVSAPALTLRLGEEAARRAQAIDPQRIFAPVFSCLRDAAGPRPPYVFFPQQTGVPSC